MKYFSVPVPSMMLETQLSHINGNPIYKLFSDKMFLGNLENLMRHSIT